MARKKFTFESNVDKIVARIEATPEKVLNIIGQNIVREIKPTIPRRTSKLRKSLGFWARKKEKDLLVGFYNNKHAKHKDAAFYSSLLYNPENDPIKPVAVKNAKMIQQMILVALNEIGKK